MRTEKISVYKFGELAPKIQEKVISRFRENDDMPFLEDELNEHLKELLRKNKIKEIKDLNLYYSLSYCQGDGVCFEGTFKWKQYTVYIKHSGTYFHSKSVGVDIKTTNGNDANETVYKTFWNLYHSICELIEKAGYEKIEYQTSEENIKERIEGNDYEFYADGDIFP